MSILKTNPIPEMYRAWINQPSTLQPFHRYHTKNVIAQKTQDQYTRIYFTDGDVISMEIPKLCLSNRWINIK